MEGEGEGSLGPRPKAQKRSSLNLGRPSVSHKARTAVTAGLRRARDGLAAASIRVKGAVAARSEAPSNLVEAWRVVAGGELPDAAALDALCCFTLARWSKQALGDKIKLLEAWASTQLEHGATFTPPRPLLRAMAKSLWAEGGSATAAELSMAALRAAPFLKTPAADLARGILDAAVHWSAELVAAEGAKAVTGLTGVLSLAPHASRTDATQRELHALRLAASEAKSPEQVLEEAIYQRVNWTKTHLRCDSVTARRRVAASLARDTMEHGGDMRSTFIKAFGHAPEAGIAEGDEDEAEEEEGEEGGIPAIGGGADTRDALKQWERSASEKMRQEAAAAAEREAAEIRAATLRAAAAWAESAQLAAARAAAQRDEAWRAGAARAAAVEEIQPAGCNTPPACPGHTLTTVLASPPS